MSGIRISYEPGTIVEHVKLVEGALHRFNFEATRGHWHASCRYCPLAMSRGLLKFEFE